jgi:hypothetical protein
MTLERLPMSTSLRSRRASQNVAAWRNRRNEHAQAFGKRAQATSKILEIPQLIN